MADYKAEILETEKAFARLAREKGLQTAFLTYAADGAVLHREGRLIEGRQAIAAYYEQRASDDAKMEWTPDFVEVAASGDLGYTYGKFIYEGKDRAGQVIKREGIFHTVWKRSANGEWRYVWD